MSQNQSREIQVAETPGALKTYLEKSKEAIKLALPKHLNPDRMLRLALTCFSTTPKLRQCSVQSILSSIVVASQLGLEPGISGQGYLIPYKTTCTFVPGWQGLVGLLNNTGRATVWTDAVFQGDEFEFEKGSHPKLRHVPGENYGIVENMTHAYAVGKVNGSEHPVVECWPVARIWKHRDRYNKVGGDHYSFKHPEMYARKVVLLQVLKYMPKSIELQDALTVANAEESGSRVERTAEGVIIEIAPEPTDIPAEPAFEQQQPTRTAGGPTATVTATVTPNEPTEEELGDQIIKLCEDAKIDAEELLKWAYATRMLQEGENFAALNLQKKQRIVNGWGEVVKQIIERRK